MQRMMVLTKLKPRCERRAAALIAAVSDPPHVASARVEALVQPVRAS